MNIKDQIRAEIDARRQNMVYELYGLPEDGEKYIRVKGMHDAYVDMLTYIDYHLPEQPVEGLEEEVKRYYADNFDYISSEQPTLSILTNISRHFAEWQKKRDDLETADLLAIAHLQGMEQQKAKMLEDAVEGEVAKILPEGVASIHYDPGFGIGEMAYFCAADDALDEGDKVKIIIVKEDGK